jgi:hypothetical protein
MSDGSSAWRGAEILELARRMAAAPLSAQVGACAWGDFLYARARDILMQCSLLS